MSVETPHYTYFTVTGRYLRRIIDGPDEDRLPDVVPSTGSFTFTPKAPTFKDLSIPATFENVTQTGTLDASGFLVDEQGRPGVVLMSGNSPHISPQGWTWSVTPMVNGKQGTPFDLPADIEPGSTVDLTIVSPAASNAGAVIIVSEASRVAAEAARDQAVAAAETILDGVEDAVEAYLLANPPTGTGGGAVDSVNGQVGVIVLSAADVGAVPTTRTVAGKALSSNVTLSKADVGLSNVDNTSDSAKPVSSATQTALDLKAPLASPTFTGTVSGVSKAHVGLGNVDNTADMAKPVSTAQATAIATKVPLDAVRVVIYATAANTWPTRSSSIPAGFTGRVEWDHSAFGPVTTLPGSIATNDWVTDEVTV